jgi:glyoxylase-like metal-dependent hydrolase (beta-lactamase superfamily II)
MSPVIQIDVLDLEFLGSPEVIASYLVRATPEAMAAGDGHVIVDCGPGSTLPKLIEGLEATGVAPREVKHLLLTHIHLDHAGAAGTLAREFGWTVYVHRNGAGHMERPEKLIESAARIYGEMMDALWGAFEPVPSEKLVVLDGGELLEIAGHSFRPLYTPGHAIHHLAYGLESVLFTGDVGGVRIPGASIVNAPTPPPDIDLAAWRESVKLLRAQNARSLYVTHYGAYHDQAPPVGSLMVYNGVQRHFDSLLASIDQLETVSLEALRAGGGRAELTAAIKGINDEIAQEVGPVIAKRYELATPFEMAASGLERYWKRRRPEALEP